MRKFRNGSVKACSVEGCASAQGLQLTFHCHHLTFCAFCILTASVILLPGHTSAYIYAF